MENIKLEFTGERFFISEEKNWELYYQHIARYLFARRLVKNKLVLDAACGAGYGAAILAPKASKIVGIDISKEAIDYCKKKYNMSNTTFAVMDCASIAFPDELFDLIVSFETLEHISEVEKYVQELHRILKPEGQLVISTPNRDVYAIYNKGQKNKFHTYEFDDKGFRELMKPYFEIEDIYGQRYFAPKDVTLLTPYTSMEIPTAPDGIFKKIVRVGMRIFLPDGLMRRKLISYEIWANKCRVGDIVPSKAVYMVGVMRKKQKVI